MKLEERALLVKQTIGYWSANKTDKQVTKEVIENHKAQGNAGHFNKKLISSSALKQIVKTVGAARMAHYTMTLPWLDDGARIVTTVGYESYTKTMRSFKATMMEHVNDFLENYEEHKKRAKRDLGDMFNPDDYPTREALKVKFYFDVEPRPLPASSDFRAKVSDSATKAIIDDIERRTKERMEQAMKDVYSRIADVTEKMATKLAEYQPRFGAKRAENTFKESLVENVEDLLDVLPMLNLTDDPKLNKIIDDMRKSLVTHSAEELRVDDKARKATAKKAKDIYDKVSQFIA